MQENYTPGQSLIQLIQQFLVNDIKTSLYSKNNLKTGTV